MLHLQLTFGECRKMPIKVCFFLKPNQNLSHKVLSGSNMVPCVPAKRQTKLLYVFSGMIWLFKKLYLKVLVYMCAVVCLCPTRDVIVIKAWEKCTPPLPLCLSPSFLSLLNNRSAVIGAHQGLSAGGRRQQRQSDRERDLLLMMFANDYGKLQWSLRTHPAG